ncbi:hypothetical protein FGB62_345g06 [Gracilaria domingensis]|nr:hypothetical protein FGB62_345g06 [Gracilaria domingensis]
MVHGFLDQNPEFFTGSTAWLKDTSRKQRGVTTFIGLKVNGENCEDIKILYDVRFRSKAVVSKGPCSGYINLKSVAGQFLRWAVTCSLVDQDAGWKEGSLFEANKCNALIVIAKVARSHLRPNLLSKLEKVLTYLNGSASTAKDGARREARRKRLLEIEFENALLADGVVQKATRLAMHKLTDILRTASQDAQDRQGTFLRRMKSNHSLVRKWCINFTALLVLTGGGQRPQAYASLQAPTTNELNRDIETDFGKFFSLRTNLDEKTNRSLSFPVVLFPRDALKFVEFHVEHILPFLRAKFKLAPDSEDNRMLYHTEDGGVLSSNSISRTIKAFLGSMDSKLSHLTTMSIRSYYATSMIHAFRKGDIGENNSEQRFLELLEKRMNTSLEELKAAYVYIFRSDFEEATKYAMKHFTIVMKEDI